MCNALFHQDQWSLKYPVILCGSIKEFRKQTRCKNLSSAGVSNDGPPTHAYTPSLVNELKLSFSAVVLASSRNCLLYASVNGGNRTPNLQVRFTWQVKKLDKLVHAKTSCKRY